MSTDGRHGLVGWVQKHFFYGWAMVGVAGLGIFVSGPGQSHTFSVFVKPISEELGVSSATMASAYGIATLIAALLLPQMGRLIDRHGAKRMLIAITLALGAACLFFGAAANFLWLAAGFGLLRFFGQGSLMLGSANLVSQWFSRTRGFAMSLMALGFAVSMAIHPPLSQFLVDEIGWRQAWVVLGILTWILMLPPVILAVINTPEEVRLKPDGDTPDTDDDGPKEKPVISGITLSEALRTRTFYLLSFGWFAMAGLVTSLHFYQVTLLTGQGVSTEVAASVFTVSAVAMVLTMPLVGKAFDRFRTRYVFGTGLLVMAASLVSITFASGLWSATAYAIIFGINNAFSMTMFGYIWPRYFGRAHLGSIQGTGQMIGVFGASFGPLPVGLALDMTGSAETVLRLMAIYPVLAAVLAVAFLATPHQVESAAGQE